MSKANNGKCSNFFSIVFLIIFIRLCSTAPASVNENAYTQFISELIHNKCSVPSQVHLPFNTSHLNNFEYLSSNLEICQKIESTKRNKEAVVLCKEIFDNIRNITCPTKTTLPDSIRVSLSENVCKDIGVLKPSVPEDKSLLKSLTNGVVCDIMCDSEFEKACQVLLWSFEVRKQIASAANPQEPKQHSMPGDGTDTNVDSIKKDIAIDGDGFLGISIDKKNEKNSSEEAKEVTEAVGHNEVSEAPESGKLEDEPERKLETSVMLAGKLKQGKPDPNDKESALENQAVTDTKNEDSTDASQSASNVQTLSSVTQQISGAIVTNSNAESKPLEEMTKDEPNIQISNKQSDVINYDEANAGELHVSNTNAVHEEQIHDLNTKIPANKVVQDKKDTDIPADVYAQDNSSIFATRNISMIDKDINPGNEIPGEAPENGDKVSNFITNNDLHESANEKKANDAAADLHNNEQNSSNLVNTIDQKKHESATSNGDSLSKKMELSTTNGQTMKDATQQQTAQETTLDKTSVAKEETKADQSQTNSVSTKVEGTPDNTKTDIITNNLNTNDGTKIPSTDLKKPNVQQTEEFHNTIPDAPIIIDEKPPERSQNSKPSAVDPDGKSVIPSSLPETSTKATVALEKMEGGSDIRQPSDEEADHYDLENPEGDEYPGADYGDGGFGEVPKNKASDLNVPSPITAAKEVVEKQMEFPSRNAFGQEESDIRIISPFPEQEDSHFFFYFLSIVLIMMAGYLIFHNKQKIIALIVEGRHERNRRSHRIGYKKLETK